VDAFGRIIKAFITSGTTADCSLGKDLINGIYADAFLADRGYDTNSIISFALDCSMEVCILPKKNRREQRYYDRELYKWRHIVENTFLMLKRWRGIATRPRRCKHLAGWHTHYAKNIDSFLAAVYIRSMFDWMRYEL
jgi:transposase